MDLQMRVRSFMQSSMSQNAKHDHDDAMRRVLNILPTSMRRQVVKETRRLYVGTNLVFFSVASCSDRCFERVCCDSLRPAWLVPDEQAFNFGELCVDMLLVTSG